MDVKLRITTAVFSKRKNDPLSDQDHNPMSTGCPHTSPTASHQGTPPDRRGRRPHSRYLIFSGSQKQTQQARPGRIDLQQKSRTWGQTVPVEGQPHGQGWPNTAKKPHRRSQKRQGITRKTFWPKRPERSKRPKSFPYKTPANRPEQWLVHNRFGCHC